MRAGKTCCCPETHGFVEVEKIIKRYNGDAGSLIDVLHDAQKIYGYLPEEAIQQIAEGLKAPTSKVYGVASFYTLFNTSPKGEYIIRLCESAPCHIQGAGEILEAICETLDIKPGETTADHKFTLEFTSCLGVCGVAPAVMIGDQVYGNLTPKRIKEILTTDY